MLSESHCYLLIHLILIRRRLSNSSWNSAIYHFNQACLLTFKFCMIGPISFATRPYHLPLSLLRSQHLPAVPPRQNHTFSSGPLHMLFPLSETVSQPHLFLLWLAPVMLMSSKKSSKPSWLGHISLFYPCITLHTSSSQHSPQLQSFVWVVIH